MKANVLVGLFSLSLLGVISTEARPAWAFPEARRCDMAPRVADGDERQLVAFGKKRNPCDPPNSCQAAPEPRPSEKK